MKKPKALRELAPEERIARLGELRSEPMPRSCIS